MTRRIQIRLLALLLTAAAFRECRAEIWNDPEPVISWQSIQDCELVIVGKYRSHQDGGVTLEVVESLKGSPSPTVVVKLEHLYTIETGPTGWEALTRKNPAGDGIPKLCYKQPFTGPGDLMPIPMLKDARQPALYFFPQANQPRLKRRGQVQPIVLRQGWKQTLDGKRADVLFRMAQRIDPNVARDAMEELGKSRDDATTDQLFKWLLDPAFDQAFSRFDPLAVLVRLAPHNQNVYDRAWKLLETQAAGANPYRFSSLASLLPLADERRAAKDLPALLQSKSFQLRKAAVVGLARLPQREATQLCLDCLRDSELSEVARSNLVYGGEDDGSSKRPGLDDDDWLTRQLFSATFDERVPEETKKALRTRMAHVWRDLPRFSVDRLLPHLTRLADPSYRGWSDGAAQELFAQARAVCDPEVIPKLVEAIDNVPAAGGHPAMHEAIQFYGLVCPQATRRALGQSRLLANTPSYLVPKEILAALETANIKPGPAPEKISDEVDRCFVLARQVREGSLDAAELFRCVDEVVRNRKLATQSWAWGVPALLESGHPSGRQRYLAYLQDAREPTVYYDHTFISSELNLLLHRLFPDYTSDYCDQVLQLLTSQSLLERKEAVKSLEFTLLSDFDFAPEALEAERAVQLARIRPLLHLLEGKSELEARGALLKAAGVALAGETAEGWLKDLPQAAGSGDRNIARNALRLVDLIVGQRRCAKLERMTPQLRARAVALYLQDIGRLGATTTR